MTSIAGLWQGWWAPRSATSQVSLTPVAAPAKPPTLPEGIWEHMTDGKGTRLAPLTVAIQPHGVAAILVPEDAALRQRQSTFLRDQLCAAARAGDLDTLQRALSLGISVLGPIGGERPITAAALTDRAVCVAWLLAQGAAVEDAVTARQGMANSQVTALLCGYAKRLSVTARKKLLLRAAETGATHLVAGLLSAYRLKATDPAGIDTPLKRAARRGHVATVQALLRAGCCGNGRTPMALLCEDYPVYDAVYCGQAAVLRALCAAGARPEQHHIYQRRGDPPGRMVRRSMLAIAAENDHWEVAAVLLDAGCPIEDGGCVLAQSTNNPVASPLMLALHRGKWKTAALLLERGADLERIVPSTCRLSLQPLLMRAQEAAHWLRMTKRSHHKVIPQIWRSTDQALRDAAQAHDTIRRELTMALRRLAGEDAARTNHRAHDCRPE